MPSRFPVLPARFDLPLLVDGLRELRRIDERRYRVVELRLLQGLSAACTSERLGRPPDEIEQDWQLARIFLFLRSRGRA